MLAAAVGAYYAWSESLWDASIWWDVAFLSTCLIPAVFGLVCLALALRRSRGLLPAGLALVLLTWLLEEAGLEAIANFGKLAAATALAFWFATYFESAAWVAFVALIVPWVDAYSVWRGLTNEIVEERPEVFDAVAFLLPAPGGASGAQLGPPDLLFFALFLATCARFGLRTGWTWLAMTLSFGVTIALTVWWDVSGLPALPGLSIAFLAVNADLLWQSFSAARRSGRSSESSRDRGSAP